MLVALLRMSVVPLQSPCLGERFCRSMRTMPFFMSKLYGGSPAGVSLFMNSTGNLLESLGSLVLSTLDSI